MAVLLTDDFNRADNTSSIGSPSVGGPYTVRQGTFGTISNQLYTSASTGNAQVTFPAAADVDLQATITVKAFAAGLLFRWTDVNNWWGFVEDSSVWRLVRVNAGAAGASSGSYPSANGDVLRVIAKGRWIYGFVNGVMRVQVEDLNISASTTTCGVRIHSSTGVRIDDLSAADAPALVPGGIDGGTGGVVDEQIGSALDLAGFVYKGRDTATADAPTALA